MANESQRPGPFEIYAVAKWLRDETTESMALHPKRVVGEAVWNRKVNNVNNYRYADDQFGWRVVASNTQRWTEPA